MFEVPYSRCRNIVGKSISGKAIIKEAAPRSEATKSKMAGR
jgi:hypothetical protein